MTLDRRNFLHTAGALALAGSAGVFPRTSAMAAPTGGYKALVCLFLKGGLDCHDTIIPFDDTSYQTNANIRSALMTSYQSVGGDAARTKSDLLPLLPKNHAALSGRQYALPPSMNSLHALFHSGNAAVVGNVGSLIIPTTRSTLDHRSSQLPKQLFSHNDQQSTWMSLGPEGEATGWGGRFADAASTANGGSVFSAISMADTEVFLAGNNTRQFQITPNAGVQSIQYLKFPHLRGSGARSAQMQALLEQHFNQSNTTSNNLLERNLGTVTRRAIATNTRYNEARTSQPALSSKFPKSNLADQLKTVAETIALRNLLNVNRQVFFVSMSGFDTHSNQARRLPAMQRIVADAISAFYQATVDLGLENDVTLFTASDFGRTLTANGDGSDHGWGGHHFVVGGSVNGQKIYGTMPDVGLGHEQELGNGRLIPTTSIEQFAAPLGRWFGLSQTSINHALPGLSSHTGAPLTFL